MRIALYAHPFDLDALAPHGGLTRLRDLGIGEVALATSYHDGRWLMPWHPKGRVRFLEDGCVHFRPRAEYGVLQPRMSSEVPADGPSPLEKLCVDAKRAGLAVRAWTVLTHNSRLGLAQPQLCVENAFGDRYSYALCPAQPEVRRYELALVRDLAAHAGLGTIELEAAGQMGWKHSSHHDKASFAPSGLLDAALSACFCGACKQSLAGAGADPAALAAAVRTFVDGALADALAPAKDGAEPAWLQPVLAGRARTVAALASDVVQATPRTARAVQVHPGRTFTGSQLAVASAAAFPVTDERVLTCYGDGPDAIGKTLSADGTTSNASQKRLCIWPKAPQFTGDEDLSKVRDLCAQHGVSSLAIYHLGLLPWRTIERAAKMLAS